MRIFYFGFAVLILLSGCDNDVGGKVAEISSEPRWVQTSEMESATQSFFEITGIVKPQHEVDISFQVSGKIDQRHVEAGQYVAKGDVLFTLDTRDLSQSVVTYQAKLEAAKAALEIARDEFSQDDRLTQQGYTSRRLSERTLLALKQAESNRDIAVAELNQALNSLDYGVIKAENDGLILSVNGESGEVVSIGQSIANFAIAGSQEIEVDFPAGHYPQEPGEVIVDGEVLTINLREVAGMADPLSRTWKARYVPDRGVKSLRYGQLVKTRFREFQPNDKLYRVKVSSIDERGEGSFVWIVDNGKARPVQVSISKIDTEYAWVSASHIKEGVKVITLGTHLLDDGLAVRSVNEREI